MRMDAELHRHDLGDQDGPAHSEAGGPPVPLHRQHCVTAPGKPKLRGAFLKGPVDFEWIARATALRKPALPIGMGLWREAGLVRDNFLTDGRPHSNPIRVASKIRKKLGMSTSQMSRGLRALANAGLVTILKGGPGRCPVVTITNLQRLAVADDQRSIHGQVRPAESEWTA